MEILVGKTDPTTPIKTVHVRNACSQIGGHVFSDRNRTRNRLAAMRPSEFQPTPKDPG